MSVDKKVENYIQRAHIIFDKVVTNKNTNSSIKELTEIAKMIQIEEILNSKIVKNIQKFTGI